MACRYYDDILTVKLRKWLPDNSTLRVLGPSETKRLFEITAEDSKDAPVQLPIVTLNRHKDIEILTTTKNPRSYDGLTLLATPDKTLQLNVIPIKLLYDLVIYTKTEEEIDEYVRNFLFKLINNPVIKVHIPYNNAQIEHIANIHNAPPPEKKEFYHIFFEKTELNVENRVLNLQNNKQVLAF